jgi:opacity protein-like surface antigen
MKKTSLVLGALCALLALPAAAQTLANEVMLFGSWDDVREPSDLEQTTIHLRYGRYMTPQAVATVGISRASFEGSGVDFTMTSFTVGGKYYFGLPRASTLVPFADLAVGVALTDTPGQDGTDFTWEIGGGAAFFLTDTTSVDASIRYYHTDTESTTKGLRMFFGITARF